ncbi:EF-hand domain containing protein [Cryptosporidium felis]|nr:EF-hand domain containing protein [Cryptosporidium felis]
MSPNNLKSSLYSSLFLSNSNTGKCKFNAEDQFRDVMMNTGSTKKGIEKSGFSKASMNLNKHSAVKKDDFSNLSRGNKFSENKSLKSAKTHDELSASNTEINKFIHKSKLSKNNSRVSIEKQNIPTLETHTESKINTIICDNSTTNNQIKKKSLDTISNGNYLSSENKDQPEGDCQFDVYLRSNLVKIHKDDNNETIISVPCKLNMDLESLFYYFSNNSIYLKCEQFAGMLHQSKLYHKSKPIDILGRMFPSDQKDLPHYEKSIEFHSFLKLLHHFSQFKFRSIGASEEEKLNLVISFLMNCEYIESASCKLVKSEKSLQIGDPTIQRKEEHIQMNSDSKDSYTQCSTSVNSLGINARYTVSDASCGCDIEEELNLTCIQDINEISRGNQNQTLDYLGTHNFEEQTPNQMDSSDYCEERQITPKNDKKLEKKKNRKENNSDSEILNALTSINQEDDKKLFRIFVYYSGPNSDRLSYRQFYNLINDSGLLGGNFEEFLTPVQLERCYSAVIVDPKGVDYWEFKEILLYCGEASSCGNNTVSAFQSIVKKYIIPLILMIYQPNNFEKCEDAISEQRNSEDVNSLQSMINRSILPWFRLGSRPLESDSDEYSDTCSCSSSDSNGTCSEDNSSTTYSSCSLALSKCK